MIKVGGEKPIKRCELNYNGYEIRRLRLERFKKGKAKAPQYLVKGLQKDITGESHGWISLYLGSLKYSRKFINQYEEDEEGHDGYYGER